MVMLSIRKINKDRRELIKFLRREKNWDSTFVEGVSREELEQDKCGPAAEEN